MDKAVQFGASLANQWNSTITHLIMDEGMPYDEFKKFHKDVKALPGHVVVINGKYIADCITFGLLIGHTQRAYQVPGYVLPESTVAEAITSIPTAFQKVAEGVATAVSKTSKVPIEPKVNTTSEEGTGRKYIMTAKGTIKSSITKAISLSPPDDNARANDTFNYDDALSKMITEAKGVAHLVSCIIDALTFESKIYLHFLRQRRLTSLHSQSRWKMVTKTRIAGLQVLRGDPSIVNLWCQCKL